MTTNMSLDKYTSGDYKRLLASGLCKYGLRMLPACLKSWSITGLATHTMKRQLTNQPALAKYDGTKTATYKAARIHRTIKNCDNVRRRFSPNQDGKRVIFALQLDSHTSCSIILATYCLLLSCKWALRLEPPLYFNHRLDLSAMAPCVAASCSTYTPIVLPTIIWCKTNRVMAYSFTYQVIVSKLVKWFVFSAAASSASWMHLRTVYGPQRHHITYVWPDHNHFRSVQSDSKQLHKTRKLFRKTS